MLHTSTLAWAAVAAVVLGVDATPTPPATAPEVRLDAGTVKGGVCSNSKVKLFQGIPYAQPPLGKLRFMPPQALEGQYPGGVLDATKTPSPCIQFRDQFAVNKPTPSEDCLHLDVYVPPNAHEHSGFPVKVYAHGGGNTGGGISWPLYDACNLANDAIVVTFNYRVGPLGFLPLDSAGIKGNAAIKDSIMALRWVKTNIARFGGMPDRVMLFSQSAGSDNSFVLSTLPEAKELISSVIFQSGGGLDVTSYDLAQKSGAAYAEYLNCSTTDLECLQSMPVEKLQDAFANTPFLKGTPNDQILSLYSVGGPNSPGIAAASIDNDLIAKQPLSVGPQVPFISGFTTDDANFLVIPHFSLDNTPAGIPNAENYNKFLLAWGDESGKLLNQTYPLSKFLAQYHNEARAVMAGVGQMVTDANRKCRAYRIHRAGHAAGTRSYVYLFNKQPTCPWIYQDGVGVIPPAGTADLYGAAHCADLPFVFGNMDNQPFGIGNCSLSAAEHEMSKTMVAAWTEMATNTSPSTPRLTWPRFGRDNKGAVFDDKITTGEIDFTECEVWDTVFAKMGGVIPPAVK